MPLKFKLYYACLVYLIIWVIIMSYFFVYALVSPSFSVETPVITIPLTTVILLAIAALAYVGLRFITHFKKHRAYTKSDLKIFSISSKISLFFSAICLLLFVSKFSQLFTIQYAGLISISLYGGLLLATICIPVVFIIGRRVVKAIDKQYETEIENIGNL